MLRTLLDLLLPTCCAGCGRRAPGVCAACLSASPPPSPVAAPRAVDWWVAPFTYTGVVRAAVIGLKYRNRRRVAVTFAVAMSRAAEPAVRMGGVDVVTWVPATPMRRRARGFDQSRVLAGEIGRQLGLPVRALLRRANSPPQTGRSRAERRGARLRFAPFGSSPARVLLVDDVATTGATLAAAAAALRAGGARAVGAVTIARTAPAGFDRSRPDRSSVQVGPPIHERGSWGSRQAL